MSLRIAGPVYRRGDKGYEEARQSVTWHAGTPERFPEVIVQAVNDDDIVAAVRLAQDENRQMAVRSGGHSFSGSHLRDGIVLLDLSALKDVSIDPDAMTATIQPAVRVSELETLLHERGLFFPVGHCADVGLGGYLLQGGGGWRTREFGPACQSLIGIEVVTAEGERLYADETQNSDLFWAARGAGPGFFAIVTKFHVRLHPLNNTTLTSVYIYPPDVWEEYLRWSRSIESSLPAEVELWNVLYREDALATEGPVIMVMATAFTDTEQQAQDALAIFETCPVRDRAITAEVNKPVSIGDLMKINIFYPPEYRFLADGMWTHATFDELRPALSAIMADFPPAPTHMVWYPWSLTPPRPQMAWSMEDELYIALYAAWQEPADDERYRLWVTKHMQAMEHVATGMSLADENLINRPQPFLAEDNLRRLDELRAQYDPNGRFVSWLGRPAVAP